MSDVQRFAEVAPDLASPSLQESYTYTIPDHLQVTAGDAVLVPFGSRTLAGIVIATSFTMPADSPVSESDLRPIRSVIDGLRVPVVLFETLNWIANEYRTPLATVVSSALPPGIRSRLVAEYTLVEPFEPESLSKAQTALIERIRTAGGRISVANLGTAKSAERTAARALVRKGILEEHVHFSDPRPSRLRLLKLASAEAAERFARDMSKRRPVQTACVQALLEADAGPMTSAEISETTGASSSIVTELYSSGILVTAPMPRKDDYPGPVALNAEQQTAVVEISQSIAKGRADKYLLFGVTGSGKTEVYLRSAAEALARGKQVLYLVPEISLTPQIISQLRGRFGESVAVMHSGLSSGERLRQWRTAQRGETPLVVGARSAIFAPLDNIGLIIVDEEHEASYKQDSTPRYHVRSVSEQCAKAHGAVLVLGSATPSIETFHRTVHGAVRRLTLSRRATDLELPTVEVADLTEGYQAGSPSLLSPPLLEAIESAIKRGEQALLFLNRRAYARALICRDCGFTPNCSNCSVSLVFHRGVRQVRCHHCGLSLPAPSTCPSCNGARIRSLGIGTERVEEFVKATFPQATVGRLDRDIASRKGATEDIFARLRSGDLQILVGTQMIAKGLDFPNVSLVGVVTADVGLSVPDFRSTEKTYQLLTQVAGRAGRHRPGRVIIQTFQPEHPAIRFAISQNYEPFYESEIKDRERASYPPFVRIANVVASSERLSAAQTAIAKIASHYAGLEGLTLTGPSDCPLSRVGGFYRKHLLLKFSHNTPTNQLDLPAECRTFRDVRVTLDVDPESLV